MPIEADEPSGLPGTVRRAVRLLEAIATTDGELGVRALARATAIDKSAVSRLLQQLAESGMVEPAAIAGRYRIGPRLFAVAAAVTSRDELWAAARPVLERLVAQFNETCYVAVREGHEVVFRDKVECDHAIRYVIDLGRPAVMHAGAAGRAILSGLGEAALDDYLEHAALEALTARTVTDPGALRQLVSQDRTRGYSVSLGERRAGGAGVAAPFHTADGRCAGSLVMTMPMIRLEEDIVPIYGKAMVAAAAELSARLGFADRTPAVSAR